MDYPWYAEVTDGTLDQGDVLPDCPAGYLPIDWHPDREEQEFQIDMLNLVVLTQACDLAHDKTEYVACCAVLPHDHLNQDWPGRGSKYINSQKNRILKGLVPGYAMIAEHQGEPFQPVSVVSFRQVYSLPKAFLKGMAEAAHLRLLPPYREHISQGFARFFMRVGLPMEIPSFGA